MSINLYNIHVHKNSLSSEALGCSHYFTHITHFRFSSLSDSFCSCCSLSSLQTLNVRMLQGSVLDMLLYAHPVKISFHLMDWNIIFMPETPIFFYLLHWHNFQIRTSYTQRLAWYYNLNKGWKGSSLPDLCCKLKSKGAN